MLTLSATQPPGELSQEPRERFLSGAPPKTVVVWLGFEDEGGWIFFGCRARIQTEYSIIYDGCSSVGGQGSAPQVWTLLGNLLLSRSWLSC